MPAGRAAASDRHQAAREGAAPEGPARRGRGGERRPGTHPGNHKALASGGAKALTSKIKAEGFLEGSTHPASSSTYSTLPADTLWRRSGRRAGEKSRDPDWF